VVCSRDEVPSGFIALISSTLVLGADYFPGLFGGMNHHFLETITLAVPDGMNDDNKIVNLTSSSYVV
jgi:hypothetical protein